MDPDKVIQETVEVQKELPKEEKQSERYRKEREKLLAEMDAERKARADLEGQLKRIEEERKQADLARMQPDERVQAQIQELQNNVSKTREQLEQERLFFSNQLQAMKLVAYRERALRDVGSDIIPEMVNGGSEEEIDQALEMSKATYNRIASSLKKQFQGSAEAASQNASVAHVMQQANPHYVSPQQDGVLPTVTNPIPVSESYGPATMDVREMTSEQAVRSGKYGGEVREQLHRMLQAMPGYRGDPSSAPRSFAGQQAPTVGYVQQPNNVMQPQGHPTGPVNPPSMDGKALARAAVQRTHQGQNPVMAANSGAQGALMDAQAAAKRLGQTSTEMYASRFSDSPPTNGGQ